MTVPGVFPVLARPVPAPPARSGRRPAGQTVLSQPASVRRMAWIRGRSEAQEVQLRRPHRAERAGVGASPWMPRMSARAVRASRLWMAGLPPPGARLVPSRSQWMPAKRSTGREDHQTVLMAARLSTSPGRWIRRMYPCPPPHVATVQSRAGRRATMATRPLVTAVRPPVGRKLALGAKAAQASASPRPAVTARRRAPRPATTATHCRSTAARRPASENPAAARPPARLGRVRPYAAMGS